MSQRNNIISVYNSEELAELHAKHSNQELEVLAEEYDTLVDELEGFELKLTKKQRQPLMALLESNSLYELPFTLSRGALELHEELSGGKNIGIGHYRIFQKIYTSTKFTNLADAKILYDALESTRDFNIAIGKIEEKLKIVAEYAVRAEQEVATGLEYKKGDNDSRLEVEEVAQAVHMEVVK